MSSTLQISCAYATPLVPALTNYEVIVKKLFTKSSKTSYMILSFLSLRDQSSVKNSCKNWKNLLHQINFRYLNQFSSKTQAIAGAYFKFIINPFKDKQNSSHVFLKYEAQTAELTFYTHPCFLLQNLFTQFSPQLTAVDFEDSLYIEPKIIELLAQTSPQLRSIILPSQSPLTDLCISVLAENCTRLTCISLEGQKRLTDVSLIAIAQHCPELNILNCTGCDLMTESTLLQLQQHYTKLNLIC